MSRLAINPISTLGGVFSTPSLFFAGNIFVLEPISSKFADLYQKINIELGKKNNNVWNLKPGSCDMTIFGE